MQILDSSMFGLRGVRAVFRKTGRAVEVTLFPMVHVGEAEFYEQVYRDALEHDVILYEGVGSPKRIHMSKAYRWMKPERLGLIVQPKLPQPNGHSVRIERADLNAAEFLAEWRKIPLWQRIIFQIAAPAYGLVQRFVATRERLAEQRSMTDKMSGDEILNMLPSTDAIRRCIVDARDERLLQHLERELDIAGEEVKRVAVIYGAGHMRAVIRRLTSLGFHCAEARWLTIFKL